LLALLAFAPGARATASHPLTVPAAGYIERAQIVVRSKPLRTAPVVTRLSEFEPDFRRRIVLDLRPVYRQIIIRRSLRTLELRDHGKLLLRTKVAIGAPGMETPTGMFYVIWGFRPPNPFLGVWAFATSAYSSLSEWPGGGIVGIHGTSAPQLLGQAVSHGCIRVSNSAVLVLKRYVRPGTPIRILD
jgi:lipoprotein-anchoring transpeptidase ErfK/SrfK